LVVAVAAQFLEVEMWVALSSYEEEPCGEVDVRCRVEE
jgi:hypothetical protein